MFSIKSCRIQRLFLVFPSSKSGVFEVADSNSVVIIYIGESILTISERNSLVQNVCYVNDWAGRTYVPRAWRTQSEEQFTSYVLGLTSADLKQISVSELCDERSGVIRWS